MSLYAMNAQTEGAALSFFLGTAKRRADLAEAIGAPVETWADVLAAIPQHPAAKLASAVDDAWLAALDAQKEAGQ